MNTKIHLIVAGSQCALGFILSGGEASDAMEGRLLLDTLGRVREPGAAELLYLLMGRAYEDGETRYLAFEWGYSPVVPPMWACTQNWNCTEAGKLF